MSIKNKGRKEHIVCVAGRLLTTHNVYISDGTHRTLETVDHGYYKA